MDLSLERKVCYLISVRNVSAQDFPSGPLAKTLLPVQGAWVRSLIREMKWSPSVVSNSMSPHGLYSPWNSPGQNTGVGSLSLLRGIFPTQRLNPGLPHCRQILHQLSYKGSPRILEWVAYPFSRGSSRTRNVNRGLLHCRRILYQLSYQDETGAYYTEWSKPERKTSIQYTNSYIWTLER